MGMYYWGCHRDVLHIRCARIPVLAVDGCGGMDNGSSYARSAGHGVDLLYVQCTVVRVRERAERGAYHCIMRVVS